MPISAGAINENPWDGTLNNQPHIHLKKWIFIGYIPFWRAPWRVKQLGYHPKGTSNFLWFREVFHGSFDNMASSCATWSFCNADLEVGKWLGFPNVSNTKKCRVPNYPRKLVVSRATQWMNNICASRQLFWGMNIHPNIHVFIEDIIWNHKLY